MKKKLVVFSGAGISAESGLKTFRDADGLWENYKIEDVATPEAWRRNPELVQEFYNLRRKAVLEAKPNKAHFAIAELDHYFDVTVITQNIDDLHERAGSRIVLHLHGEITKACSSLDKKLVYEIKGSELKMGERCERGSQLRPFIVWFGEEVPMMGKAISKVNEADFMLIVGTSLQVYPAAGLVMEAKPGAKVWLVDMHADELSVPENIKCIKNTAGMGLPALVKKIIEEEK